MTVEDTEVIWIRSQMAKLLLKFVDSICNFVGVSGILLVHWNQNRWLNQPYGTIAKTFIKFPAVFHSADPPQRSAEFSNVSVAGPSPDPHSDLGVLGQNRRAWVVQPRSAEVSLLLNVFVVADAREH